MKLELTLDNGVSSLLPFLFAINWITAFSALTQLESIRKSTEPVKIQ